MPHAAITPLLSVSSLVLVACLVVDGGERAATPRARASARPTPSVSELLLASTRRAELLRAPAPWLGREAVHVELASYPLEPDGLEGTARER